MKWKKIDDDLPADELDVLVCDKHGNLCIGFRDEHGWFHQYQTTDRIYDVVLWAYIEKPQISLDNGIIATTEWVDAIHKAGRFK